MSVKYIKISIAIHGVSIEEEATTNFLVGWIREAAKAGLLGEQRRGRYKFRNESDDDIEVEVEEVAGEYDQ